MAPLKNKNDLIPGTNIRKSFQSIQTPHTDIRTDSVDHFLDDVEGDELLANLDL